MAKLETEKKRGDFSPIFYNAGDALVVDATVAKAVFSEATTGKYPKPAHYTIYAVGECNLDPGNEIPVLLTVYEGKAQAWDSKSKSVVYEDSESMGLLWTQLADAEFPRDGFKGQIRLLKDAKSYKGMSPIKDLETVEDVSSLPKLPDDAANGGRAYAKAQTKAEALQESKAFLIAELREWLTPEVCFEAETLSAVLKLAGVTETKEYLTILLSLLK
jgi:hypothetical protein